MRVVLECASQVPALFEALTQGHHDQVTALKESIFEAVVTADEGKDPAWKAQLQPPVRLLTALLIKYSYAQIRQC